MEIGRICSVKKLTILTSILTLYLTFRFFLPPTLEGLLSPTNLALAFSIEILGWKLVLGLSSLFATISILPTIINLVWLKENILIITNILNPVAVENLEARGLTHLMDFVTPLAFFLALGIAFTIRPLVIFALKKYVVKVARF